jgi:hypothetical protein
MGFVELTLATEEGDDCLSGDFKLWISILEDDDLGETRAEVLVRRFVDVAREEEVLEWVSGAKVSTDAHAVLVVYLDECVSECDGRRAMAVALAMKAWAGGSQVRAGWSWMGGSPTLAVLLSEGDDDDL